MSVEAVFAAVGDPTRRRIVEQLSRADATVNELAAPFPMTLQAVAKHIRILESAGVVRKKKIGRSYHCSLNQAALSDVRAWIERLERDWSDRLDRLGRYLDEETKRDQVQSRAGTGTGTGTAAGAKRNGSGKGHSTKRG